MELVDIILLKSIVQNERPESYSGEATKIITTHLIFFIFYAYTFFIYNNKK
jgi:hypothetical protein